MAPLDDAEAYFGKPGEIIVCGLSGARTYPRVGNSNQQRQESPPALEMRYPSSSSPSRDSGYSSNAGSYKQNSPVRYEEPQQYPSHSAQASYGQSSPASSYSSRQYPANSQGFSGSSPSSRYF